MQLPERCVRESQKALLVPVSTKGITVHHEREIEQHSKEDSYLIQRFFLQLLSYNQSLNGEEQGESCWQRYNENSNE